MDDTVIDAVRRHDLERLRALLSAGESPNRAKCFGFAIGEYSPLGLAVRQGHLDSVVELLHAKADLSDGGSIGQPLAMAARFGFVPIIAALLDAGAHVDQRRGGAPTPLCYAAMYDHRDAVWLLLERGASPAAIWTHPQVSVLRLSVGVLRQCVSRVEVAPESVLELLRAKETAGDT